MRPEWLILNYCIQWSSFKKGKRKKEKKTRIVRQKEMPRWGGCSYKEKIRREALYCGINSLAFMILGAETIFPPSFYSFPYLLVYPFSQEFDAISPQLPWTVCTFDKGIIKFGVHLYRVLSLRIYLSVYPLFKKEQVHIYIYSVYIFRQLYSRKACMKDSMPRAFFLLWKLCVFLRDIILIFNSWEYLLEFRIFPSFFLFVRV